MTPEQYWIDRGENVIGTDVIVQGLNARQALTYRAIAHWIISHQVADLLDVGCNVAQLNWFLRMMGYEGRYEGIDSNVYALRLARDRREFLSNVAEGNLRHLTFEDEFFEAVVVKDVIEHLEGPELLSEAFRVAHRFVIVATYIPWTDEPAEIVLHADGYYTNRYNLDDVLALTAGWGFVIAGHLRVREANGTPNAVYLFRRVKGGAA